MTILLSGDLTVIAWPTAFAPTSVISSTKKILIRFISGLFMKLFFIIVDIIHYNCLDNVGKLNIRNLFPGKVLRTFSFEKGNFFNRDINYSGVDVFNIIVGIAFEAFDLFIKRILRQVQIEFFFIFDNESLFQSFAFFKMTSAKIPVVWKRD